MFFKIHHKFDCGSGPAVLISDKQINDNQWHYVAFKRDKQLGQLSVDNEAPIVGSSQGHTETINVNPPFFVGGVLPELFSVTQSRIVRVYNILNDIIYYYLVYTHIYIQNISYYFRHSFNVPK